MRYWSLKKVWWHFVQHFRSEIEIDIVSMIFIAIRAMSGCVINEKTDTITTTNKNSNNNTTNCGNHLSCHGFGIWCGVVCVCVWFKMSTVAVVLSVFDATHQSIVKKNSNFEWQFYHHYRRHHQRVIWDLRWNEKKIVGCRMTTTTTTSYFNKYLRCNKLIEQLLFQ